MLLRAAPPSSYERRQLWFCAACAILAFASMIVSIIASAKYDSAFHDSKDRLRNPGNIVALLSIFSIVSSVVVAVIFVRETARITESRPSRYLRLPLTGLILHLLAFLGVCIPAGIFLIAGALGRDYLELWTECKGRVSSGDDVAIYDEGWDYCSRQYEAIARLEFAGYVLLFIAGAVHLYAGVASELEMKEARKAKKAMNDLQLKDVANHDCAP